MNVLNVLVESGPIELGEMRSIGVAKMYFALE